MLASLPNERVPASVNVACVGRFGWPQHNCCSQVRRLPLWSAPASTFWGAGAQTWQIKGGSESAGSGRGRWTGVGHAASHPWQAACLPPVLSWCLGPCLLNSGVQSPVGRSIQYFPKAGKCRQMERCSYALSVHGPTSRSFASEWRGRIRHVNSRLRAE